MSTSYSESISQIYRIRERAKNWTSGSIFITVTVASSKNNNLPLEIDLTETIGHNKRVPIADQRGDRNCYWLQSHINENSEEFRRKCINPLFASACWRAGFLIHAQYESKHKCIRFECNRSQHHSEERESQYFKNRERYVRDPSKPPVPCLLSNMP